MHQVYLEDDQTTIDLNNTFYRIGQFWTQRTAQQNPRATSEYSDDAYLPVTERIPLVLMAGDVLALSGLVRGLQQMLSAARSRALNGQGPKVWLRIEPDGFVGTQFRAEVLGGLFELDNETLHHLGDANPCAQGVLSITREPVWRSVTPQNHILSSHTTTNNLVASIQNGNENNYVDFTPGTTLPTPAKITIANGGPDFWQGETHIYMSLNVFNDPVNFDHDQHLSTLDGAVGSGTGFNSWTAAGTTFDDLLYGYTLSANQLADAAGDYFRVMHICNITLVGAYVRAGVYAVDGTDYTLLVAGEPVRVTRSGQFLYDLGALPLPPGGKLPAQANAVAVCISISGDGAGSASLASTQLWPTASFQHLIKMDAYDVPINGFVVDDGIDKITYASTGRPVVIRKLDHIYLHGGGRPHRLYIAAMDANGLILGDDMTVSISSEIRMLAL